MHKHNRGPAVAEGFVAVGDNLAGVEGGGEPAVEADVIVGQKIHRFKINPHREGIEGGHRLDRMGSHIDQGGGGEHGHGREQSGTR